MKGALFSFSIDFTNKLHETFFISAFLLLFYPTCFYVKYEKNRWPWKRCNLFRVFRTHSSYYYLHNTCRRFLWTNKLKNKQKKYELLKKLLLTFFTKLYISHHSHQSDAILRSYFRALILFWCSVFLCNTVC